MQPEQIACLRCGASAWAPCRDHLDRPLGRFHADRINAAELADLVDGPAWGAEASA